MPGFSAKMGDVRQSMQLKKGTPSKMEGFDGLNIAKLVMGQKHSAAISEDGILYTFGIGNWGVLGHGSENNIAHSASADAQRVDYFLK